MTATGAGVGTQNNFKGPGRPKTWTGSSLLGTSSYKPNSTGLWYFPSMSDMEEPSLLLEKVMLIKPNTKTGGVAQLVEGIPGIHEALSLIPIN